MSYGFSAVLNPLFSHTPDGATDPGGSLTDRRDADVAEILAFHRRLPGYQPTPLLSLPRLAHDLGIRELLVKAESERFGLPAFKMLGASWATYRALCERLAEKSGTPDARARTLGGWSDIEELAAQLKPLIPFRLAAATDGNHGRAVARVARWLGFDARIFVPAGTTNARVEGIQSEGAEVVVVDGGYDDAVTRAAEEAGPRCLVISDTSWPGYTDVPRWVIDGYSTMFVEISEALERAGHDGVDVAVVPIGVGALAATAVVHLRNGPHPASVIGVEPSDAACITASVLAGRLVTLEGSQHSIMAGLNCGTPSPVAWPAVSKGVAGFVTIDDDWARDALRALAACGVEAGETGAAALGGLMALLGQGRATSLARTVPEDASVLVLVTEGASDLPAWREILGAQLIA